MLGLTSKCERNNHNDYEGDVLHCPVVTSPTQVPVNVCQSQQGGVVAATQAKVEQLTCLFWTEEMQSAVVLVTAP